MVALPLLWLTALFGGCTELEDSGSGPQGGEAGDTDPEGDDTGDDCVPTETYYYDADGDSFGDPDLGALLCALQPGYVDDNTDCDDLRPDVHPGLVEVCDGTDNDCDGDIDEGLPLGTWYPDVDLDGYGDPASPVSGCTQPADTIDDASDCDDADDSIHPGALELCGDHIDSDCDGVIHTCVPEGEVDLSVEAIKVVGTSAGEQHGTGGLVADLNLDGVQDLVLSSRAYDSDRGRVGVYFGPITADTDFDQADWTYLGTDVETEAGTAFVGDVDYDGDGYADFVVAEAQQSADDTDKGSLALFYGPLDSAFDVVAGDADFTWYGNSYGGLGVALAPGDFDGDGITDLGLMSMGTVLVPHSVGLVTYMPGPLDTDIPAFYDHGPLLYSGTQGSLMSYALETIGDRDGDGADDLAATDLVRTAAAKGEVYLWQGPIESSGTLTSGDHTLTGTNNGDRLGASLAGGGDHDGDGYADLLIGAPGDDTEALDGGAVRLVGGASSGAPQPAFLRSAGDGATMGAAMAFLPDLDDDGFDEVLVGGTGAKSGNGAAWLYLGPLSGTLAPADADATFITGSLDALGSWLATAEDLTGDGAPDLVIGARDDGATDAGAAWILPIIRSY